VSIKTIALNTPEECLSANTIRKKLIGEGHQLLSEKLYPNKIEISYLEWSECIGNHKHCQKNIIITESGSYAINFGS